MSVALSDDKISFAVKWRAVLDLIQLNERGYLSIEEIQEYLEGEMLLLADRLEIIRLIPFRLRSLSALGMIPPIPKNVIEETLIYTNHDEPKVTLGRVFVDWYASVFTMYVTKVKDEK